MNCKAILLAASPDDATIPGVYDDLDAFYYFLRSNIGGGWDAAEVFRGVDSTRDEILFAVNAARSFDYTLVFFAGVGEIVKTGLPWPEVRVLLKSRETVAERELNTASPRSTFIVDCSRRKADRVRKQTRNKASSSVEHCERDSASRKLYEEELTAAEGGLVKVYAMPSDEAATGISSFTEYLLNESNRWGAKNKGTLYLGDAVALAKEAMMRDGPQTQADYRGGRRLRDFPFAVKM